MTEPLSRETAQTCRTVVLEDQDWNWWGVTWSTMLRLAGYILIAVISLINQLPSKQVAFLS